MNKQTIFGVLVTLGLCLAVFVPTYFRAPATTETKEKVIVAAFSCKSDRLQIEHAGGNKVAIIAGLVGFYPTPEDEYSNNDWHSNSTSSTAQIHGVSGIYCVGNRVMWNGIDFTGDAVQHRD